MKVLVYLGQNPPTEEEVRLIGGVLFSKYYTLQVLTRSMVLNLVGMEDREARLERAMLQLRKPWSLFLETSRGLNVVGLKEWTPWTAKTSVWFVVWMLKSHNAVQQNDFVSSM
jgi:hypothetical protein